MYGCTSFNPNWISFQTSSACKTFVIFYAFLCFFYDCFTDSMFLTYVLCLSFLGFFFKCAFLVYFF